MGEKIKTLANGEIFGKTAEIELNHSVSGKNDPQVHVQTDKFRLEIGKEAYIDCALAILAAAENLKRLKGMK